MTGLFDLSGAVGLVTGASGGLGSRFTRVLAAHGASVAATARSPRKLAALIGEIGESGGVAAPFRLDVTDRASISAAFDAIEAKLGPATLLVNNAGIARSEPGESMSGDDWRDVLEVNLDGSFFMMQEFARRLIAAGKKGAVINIASILGLRPDKGVAGYAAAKAAMINLTRTLALEWARHGIRVNAIAPGWFPTAINENYLKSQAGAALKKRIPLRRFGEPHELDGALLLLASKAGSYMTGTTIVVDGGLEV
jgi:3-oxoacyl-[acyl-carrier protein] reductase